MCILHAFHPDISPLPFHFQDLLKRTPSGHADRMPLQLAMTKLETLAGVLNDRKKQAEQKHAVKQLIKNLNVKLSHKVRPEILNRRYRRPPFCCSTMRIQIWGKSTIFGDTGTKKCLSFETFYMALLTHKPLCVHVCTGKGKCNGKYLYTPICPYMVEKQNGICYMLHSFYTCIKLANLNKSLIAIKKLYELSDC